MYFNHKLNSFSRFATLRAISNCSVIFIDSVLLLKFYAPNWVNFDHFICQIDPYSGLKIDPEFRVKYIDPGFRVNLTRFASVAY